MATWVDFDRAEDGSLLTVNIDNVAFYMPEPQRPDVTRLLFINGQGLAVQGNYATIKEHIARKMPGAY